jgi:hypothetical protein
MTPVLDTESRALGESIVSARLLVMQSKRLMLASIERRLTLDRSKILLERAKRLHTEADRAHRSYQASVLTWAPTDSSEYVLVAYDSLIEVAENLSTELRGSLDDLPPADRFEVGTEVEMLEGLIGRWRKVTRNAMTPAAHGALG